MRMSASGYMVLRGFSGQFKKIRLTVFEVIRTDVAKVTMAPFSVVEHLDVLEQIGTRLLSRAIAYPVHTLSLE